MFTTGQIKVNPTPEQIVTAEMIIDQKLDKVEIWYEEEDDEMGVAVTDDGMTLVGFFGKDGELVGDWH